MRTVRHLISGGLGLGMLFTPIAFASALSVSVQSLAPGGTVLAKSLVSFTIVPSGFAAQSYQLSDSFANSTVDVHDIDPGGNFKWVPVASDAGTHIFTITAQNYSGDMASTTQTITVTPPPSVAIQSVLPGNKIMPGTKFSFTVFSPGFTNPHFSISDSFNGSSAVNAVVDTSGNVSWAPEVADNGNHTITVYASDTLGHGASASVDILVGNGPSLSIQSILPGASVSLGQTLTFSAGATNFMPTAFTVTDNFAGTSTINNLDISTAGSFSWVPSGTDVGTHVLTVTGVVGVFGDHASTTQTIHVLGADGKVPPAPASTSATQAAVSGSVLDALKAQLAALNAKIAAQAGATSSATLAPAPTSASGNVFSVYLHPGMHSDDVTHLQNVLTQQGFFSGEASGYYGPITVDAVVKFQAAHGLTRLGVVGPATRAALNVLMSGSGVSPSASTQTVSATSGGYVFQNFIGFGDHGTDVTELQKRLATLGFFSGDPSGYFGSVTEDAVKAFQNSKGIRAAGYVGPGTRAALNHS